MDDPLKGFHPLDPGRVHADDPLELRYWCREFGCSEPELLDALARVGEHVAPLRQHFEARG